MKKIKFTSMLVLVVLLVGSPVIFQSCSPEKGEVGVQEPQGPAGAQGVPGPAGATGPTGAAGQNGNANVIQIKYGSRVHMGTEINYDLPGVTAAVLSNAAYFAYVAEGNFWYALPGATEGGNHSYRAYISTSAIKLYIACTAGTGSDTFTQTRIVLIPASDLRNGRQAAVDFSDYQAVKKAYNLPD